MKKLYSLLLLALAGVLPALAQWNTNATPTCIFSTTYVDENGETQTGGDYYATAPMAVRTPDKKTWLSWKTWGRKLVNGVSCTAVRTYLQLLDRDGVPQFEQPIMVNDYATTTWWSKYGLQVAADGSAIVTVADGRGEEASIIDAESRIDGFQPAIYKIDQEGNFLWGLDGITYPQYRNSPFTNCYVVGDDTYFIFQNNTLDFSGVGDETIGTFIQRINDDGTTAWEEPYRWSPEMVQPQIVPSLDGDFLLFDACPSGARVHRLNRNLEEMWGEPVIYDEYKYDGHALNAYKLASDGNGGACVAFVRGMGMFTHNIRVQHINEDGSLGFGLTGLDAANTEDNDYDYCNIAANPQTHEILVDFESQLPSTYDVMLQKFSFDGDYLFDELGLSIANKNRATSSYAFGSVGCGALPGGDWIVVYRDVQNYVNASFVIRRYDSTGKRVWTRTIGRELDPDDTSLFVEDEAVYLFYRETRSNKEPGIKIFRIGTDGEYDVTYDEPDAIGHLEQQVAGSTRYFSPDGRQHVRPQHGLNIVRQADGSVKKQIIY